ncbi:signal peptidase I [Microbacterium sp. E-13]|uniref:signal peptidase I n=1 Tax=Microbacterium sp. E-13 TaxID=3404048 RepID=UPI003CF54BC2
MSTPISDKRSTSGQPGRSGRRRWASFARDVAVILVIAVLVSVVVKTFLVRSFYIPSGSMLNTLEIDDRILVNELQPRLFPIERGDIVVFTDPGGWLDVRHADPVRPVEWLLSLVGLAAPDSDDHLVKRVIGLPGDHVVCCNPVGELEINGVAVDEPYLMNVNGPASTSEFDVTVPKNSLWVMGDNREGSADSRSHMDQPGGGFVPMEAVVGRAFARTWPIPSFGLLNMSPDVFDGIPEPSPSG